MINNNIIIFIKILEKFIDLYKHILSSYKTFELELMDRKIENSFPE